jgi:hypothetical protein
MPDSIVSDDTVMNEWSARNGVIGSDYGLIQVLSRNPAGGTEENDGNPETGCSVSRPRSEPLQSKSENLPLLLTLLAR